MDEHGDFCEYCYENPNSYYDECGPSDITGYDIGYMEIEGMVTQFFAPCECSPGFYMTANSTCKKCPDNCKSCFVNAGGFIQCMICDYGYLMNH